MEILGDTWGVKQPSAGFYLWPELGVDDVEFCRGLLRSENVKVLPGSFLARTCSGVNPGAGRIRIALVDEIENCIEAAHRLRAYTTRLQ